MRSALLSARHAHLSVVQFTRRPTDAEQLPAATFPARSKHGTQRCVWELSEEQELWLVAASTLSLVLLALSALVAPVVIARLPEDYFVREPYQPTSFVRTPPLRVLCGATRNLLGALLVFLGVLMLVLPGQGVLTIVVGLLVMRFKAKRRWLGRLLSAPGLQHALNFIRKKTGQPTLQFPPRKGGD